MHFICVLLQDQIDNKKEHEKKIQNILESNDEMQVKMDAFRQLQAEVCGLCGAVCYTRCAMFCTVQFDAKKDEFVQKIENKMDDLQNAVNFMENKLNVMGSYYDDMIKDHDKFINFVMDQGDKYGEELGKIKSYLEELGSQIKGKRRDLYEGQAEDVERKTFSADYEVCTVQQSTEKVKNKSKNCNARIGAAVGFGVGALTGALVAGSMTCGLGATAGFIFGGAIGGAVGGCIIGGLIDKVTGNNKDKYETTTHCTKRTETITLTGADCYSGDKQNEKLQKILTAMEGEFQRYGDKLRNAKQNASEQKREAEDFKTMIGGMKAQIKSFNESIKEIKDSLKNAVIDAAFKKKMNNKQLVLMMQVKKLSMELKDKSKSKPKWQDDDDEKECK